MQKQSPPIICRVLLVLAVLNLLAGIGWIVNWLLNLSRLETSSLSATLASWCLSGALVLWICSAGLGLLSRIAIAAEGIQGSQTPAELLRSLNILSEEAKERKQQRDEVARQERIRQAEEKLASHNH